MNMFPLKPGVVFNFETTGPITPNTQWTFEEFYSPEDREGSFTQTMRKILCLRMVNRAIRRGYIDRAGKWEATVFRRGTRLRIRLKHIGPCTGSTKL
jgi:hypothetical protein